MSNNSDVKKITTNTLQKMKENGEKISMLTAYDFSLARIVDSAGVEVILVGDSASNVIAGHETTLPITLDQMIYHASSVVRGTDRALVVVDLPFGTYQSDSKEALRSARYAVKLNGQDPQSRINLSLALLETNSKGVRDHIDYVKRAMFVLPELEKELKESFEDGLSRKPNWKTLLKIKNWLDL